MSIMTAATPNFWGAAAQRPRSRTARSVWTTKGRQRAAEGSAVLFSAYLLNHSTYGHKPHMEDVQNFSALRLVSFLSFLAQWFTSKTQQQVAGWIFRFQRFQRHAALYDV